MDVRGILLHRLGQQGIDQTDDGCIVLGLQQVFRFGQFLGDAGQVQFIPQSLHHLHGLTGLGFIARLQQLIELLLGDRLEL